MKGLLTRLLSVAGLFLMLAGFASPRTVQAKGQCASGSGSGTSIATSPAFAVQPGDTVTATIRASNPSDFVALSIALFTGGPVAGNSGTGTTTATFPVTTTDFAAAQFIDITSLTSTFTWSISINSGCSAGPGPLFNDGRLNRFDGAETAAIYCNKGGLDIYYIGDPWKMVLKVTAHEIDLKPTHPTTNTLIKENAQIGVALYRLTTGQLQVNAPGGDDGKGPYVFIFPDNCPRN